jgi:chemotaxis methyl-accepting protein methylase
MAAAGIQEASDYIATLRQDSRELELLPKDFLIHVTSFFRDPAAFEGLAKMILPGLVSRAGGQPIRAWVPGCSTGEEAYSPAILFIEEFTAQKRSVKLQIFASDISGEALASAREGLYPESIKGEEHLPKAVLMFADFAHEPVVRGHETEFACFGHGKVRRVIGGMIQFDRDRCCKSEAHSRRYDTKVALFQGLRRDVGFLLGQLAASHFLLRMLAHSVKSRSDATSP